MKATLLYLSLAPIKSYIHTKLSHCHLTPYYQNSDQLLPDHLIRDRLQCGLRATRNGVRHPPVEQIEQTVTYLRVVTAGGGHSSGLKSLTVLFCVETKTGQDSCFDVGERLGRA